jgi:hypothetical protein
MVTAPRALLQRRMPANNNQPHSHETERGADGGAADRPTNRQTQRSCRYLDLRSIGQGFSMSKSPAVATEEFDVSERHCPHRAVVVQQNISQETERGADGGAADRPTNRQTQRSCRYGAIRHAGASHDVTYRASRTSKFGFSRRHFLRQRLD